MKYIYLKVTPFKSWNYLSIPTLLGWNGMPLKLLMDTTVDVISAREAWDMARLRADGGFDIGSTGPRGSGVSVIVLDSGVDATHPDMNCAPQSVNNPNTPDWRIGDL